MSHTKPNHLIKFIATVLVYISFSTLELHSQEVHLPLRTCCLLETQNDISFQTYRTKLRSWFNKWANKNVPFHTSNTYQNNISLPAMLIRSHCYALSDDHAFFDLDIDYISLTHQPKWTYSEMIVLKKTDNFEDRAIDTIECFANTYLNNYNKFLKNTINTPGLNPLVYARGDLGNISNEIIDPLQISKPFELPYPPLARIARIDGTVGIEVIVSPSGIPLIARRLSGPTQLFYSTAGYVLLCKYPPASSQNNKLNRSISLSLIFSTKGYPVFTTITGVRPY